MASHKPKFRRTTPFEAEAPDKAHLALYTSFKEAIAIPPGAMMGVVMDPTKLDPLQRIVLVEVRRDRLVFRCTCTPQCHVIHEFIRHEHGTHQG